MPTKDFRYTLEGQTIEGFQMTEQTRYREKDWPDWMDSRFLITYEGGEQRLSINDVETVIPKFGWIVKYPDGSISAVGYEVMELADKMVKEEEIVHPEAAVDEEGLLLLASKLSGKSVEKLRAEQEERKPAPGRPAKAPPDSDLVYREKVAYGEELLGELKGAYNVAKSCEPTETLAFLNDALSKRVNWCACSPGSCDGEWDQWGCRKNSPLVQ
jgi:hypothetical protein